MCPGSTLFNTFSVFSTGGILERALFIYDFYVGGVLGAHFLRFLWRVCTGSTLSIFCMVIWRACPGSALFNTFSGGCVVGTYLLTLSMVFM